MDRAKIAALLSQVAAHRRTSQYWNGRIRQVEAIRRSDDYAAMVACERWQDRADDAFMLAVTKLDMVQRIRKDGA